MWCIQDEDCRRILPPWMSQILEIQVCQYVSEYEKWSTKINKRAAEGKPLTKTQADLYNRWQADCERKLIFCKQRKKLISDAKEISPSCIAVKLHLSDEPEMLQLSTGGSEQKYRLMLLRGDKPEAEIGAVPDALDAPVPADMIPVPGEDSVSEQEEEVLDGAIDNGEPAANDEGMVSEAEGDTLEILADTDDDLDLLDITVGAGGDTKSVAKVKSFHHRDAWQKLEKLGLVAIPTHVNGCSIGFHRTSNQWQGYYPNCHEGLSARFGGTTKRSECESIIKVVRGILVAHTLKYPKDKMWKLQLSKVQAAEATQTF